MKRSWMKVLVILTVLALGPAVTVSSAPSMVVKIGNLAPNTGVGAAFGETQTNGALLAIEEINAAGGIPGVGRLEMVTEDTGSTPTGAVNAANKLIQQHRVVAIVGEAMSGNTLDAAATNILEPSATKLVPPAIPPMPVSCVPVSPFSTQTSMPQCGGTTLGDTAPPSVTISLPVSGQSVVGNTNFAATASDNLGVVGVQFLINGSPAGGELTSAPYAAVWASTAVTNGTYTLGFGFFPR